MHTVSRWLITHSHCLECRSTFAALFLTTDNFEPWCVLLRRTGTRRSLLSDLVPSSAAILVLVADIGREIRSRRVRNDTAVGEFAATDEFFSKTTAIDGARGRVDRVRDNFRFSWEVKKGSDEAIN